MKFTPKIAQRVLILPLALLLILGSMIWIQATASPASAQEPDDGADLLIEIILDGNEVRSANIISPPVFNVGDTFKVAVVAQGVDDPGIFGGQFEITFDTVHLQAVDDSLQPGMDLEPVIVAVSELDNTTGLVRYAVSRQGDVTDVAGNVVLATLRFEAVGATEPPEGQTTTIHLQNVKLGAKGGIDVPVAGLVDLNVIIREDDTVPDKGDIAGNVTVEGRAADNQAGHTVTATSDQPGLTETTAANGDFLFNNAPAGTYTLTADRAGFLAAACEGVVHTADALTSLEAVILLAGDIDGKDGIDITDAVAIGTVLGSTEPEVADLNDDGVVDILDLILMAVNYGQTSAANPWLCQVSNEL